VVESNTIIPARVRALQAGLQTSESRETTVDQKDDFEASRELPEEPRDLLKEEKARYKEIFHLVVNNWAKIASAAVIVLSYIQYAYKYGICKVFSLPISAVTISLTDYIPAVAILFAIVLYVTDCFITLNPKNIDGKPRFSLFRIICGTAVAFMALSIAFNDGSVSLLLLLLISVVPPLIIEFLLRNRSLKAVREKVEKSHRYRLKSAAEDKLFYKHFVRPVLIVVLIVILLIPIFSGIVTSHKDFYEICTIDDNNYAVILSSADSVVVQPAVIEGDSLTIYTGSFRYVAKTDIEEFVFMRLDQVTIAEGRN